jgi:hypothetical protein
MATIKQGILGAFSGKIANVVGGSWKGIATMRKLPASVTNPRTAGQVNNRNEFGSIAKFASSINASIIKPLWDRFAVKMSGYNAFVMQNKGVFNATGAFIAPNLVTSLGKLGQTAIGACVYDPISQSVTVSWDATPVGAYQLATDKAYIVVADSLGNVLGVRSAQDSRQDAAITFTVSESISPAPFCYVYLAFSRIDGSIVGDSAFKQVSA